MIYELGEFCPSKLVPARLICLHGKQGLNQGTGYCSHSHLLPQTHDMKRGNSYFAISYAGNLLKQVHCTGTAFSLSSPFELFGVTSRHDRPIHANVMLVGINVA